MQKPANPPSFSAKSFAFTEYVSIKNWIGGNWREGATGNWLEVVGAAGGRG